VLRLLFLLLIVVLALFALELTVLGRAWMLHRAARWEDEIAWLETMRPWVPWERGLEAQIDRLYRERVRRELDASHLTGALEALRVARRRELEAGRALDHELMALGIESYARTADYVEDRGRLSRAADWDDSLFVFAVRGPEPHQRYAATAAFMEALDLRVRDGKPCAALARVEWAKRGLGGEIPGMAPSVEADLRAQCRAAGSRPRR
jgi:hypothetical protein